MNGDPQYSSFVLAYLPVFAQIVGWLLLTVTAIFELRAVRRLPQWLMAVAAGLCFLWEFGLLVGLNRDFGLWWALVESPKETLYRIGPVLDVLQGVVMPLCFVLFAVGYLLARAHALKSAPTPTEPWPEAGA